FLEPLRFLMLFRSTLRMVCSQASASSLRRPRSINFRGTLHCGEHWALGVLSPSFLELQEPIPGTPLPCALHLLRCRFNDDFVPNLFSQPPMQR
ncbi:hypothetical protein K443DRAFT_111543, partial [Laccaria amethystina LaAM-08-1]